MGGLAWSLSMGVGSEGAKSAARPKANPPSPEKIRPQGATSTGTLPPPAWRMPPDWGASQSTLVQARPGRESPGACRALWANFLGTRGIGLGPGGPERLPNSESFRDLPPGSSHRRIHSTPWGVSRSSIPAARSLSRMASAVAKSLAFFAACRSSIQTSIALPSISSLPEAVSATSKA